MTKETFYESVITGREIEFTCENISYFESRENDEKWYIYNEKDKTTQYFCSAEELLENAKIQDVNINEMWDKIIIDFIL